MKIVLDTNVLVAAFISHGTCAELLEHSIRNHNVILSPFILGELRHTLEDKFQIDTPDVTESVELLSSKVIVVHPEELSEPVCRDPDDDNILAAAISGGCDCIVSGDNDLLVIGKFQGIKILKPSDYWKFEATRHEQE